MYVRAGVAAPRDWNDLLHPRLKGRIAFSSSSRELVGIALKTLGLEYNSNVEAINSQGISESVLRERVRDLKKQALLFGDRSVYAYEGGVEHGKADYEKPLVTQGNVQLVSPWNDGYFEVVGNGLSHLLEDFPLLCPAFARILLLVLHTRHSFGLYECCLEAVNGFSLYIGVVVYLCHFQSKYALVLT